MEVSAIKRDTVALSPDVVFYEKGDRTVAFQRRALTAIELDAEAVAYLKAACPDPEVPLPVDAMLLDLSLWTRGDARIPSRDVPVLDREIHISTYRIVLTEACNLRCTYCFQEDTTDRMTSMSPDTLMRVVDEIISRHRPDEHISIHWFGGEPLLKFKLIRAATERLARAVDDGRIGGVVYDMTTHGGLVNDVVAGFLAENNVDVLVSLDGGKELNDRARVDKKGRGTFDAAIRGFRTLKAHGVNVGVIVTSSVETGHELAQGITDLLDMLDPKRVHINTPQPTPDGWQVDGRVFAEQLFAAAEACDARGVQLVGPHQKIRRALNLQEAQNLDCVAPSGGMAVSVGPNGQFGHCIVSWNGADHSQPIDAWDYLKAETWKTRSHKTETCRSCPAEHVCGGPCPLEAELIGLDPQRCAFYLTTLEKVLVS